LTRDFDFISFITGKSSLETLLEDLLAQIHTYPTTVKKNHSFEFQEISSHDAL